MVTDWCVSGLRRGFANLFSFLPSLFFSHFVAIIDGFQSVSFLSQ